MVTISATYDGSLRCTATHGPSGTILSTDAPRDNQGLGASFSPTDLLATAHLTCAMTTMAIAAKREGIAFGEARGEVVKEMAADPRRVARTPMRIHMPPGLSDAERRVLESVARNCPVAKSIHPGLEAPIEFVYADRT